MGGNVVCTRRSLYVVLALAHLVGAYTTFRFVQKRTQDSDTTPNVLCGFRETLGEFERDSKGGRDGGAGAYFSYDGDSSLESAVLKNFAQVCHLNFSSPSSSSSSARENGAKTAHIHRPGGDVSEGTTDGASTLRPSDGTRRQFDRFLMFFTDCWPHAYAKNLLPVFEEHAQVFLVDIPGAKYSHAIYTSYLTGQPTTNYEGREIAGDHLVRSMKRSFVQQRSSEDVERGVVRRPKKREWLPGDPQSARDGADEMERERETRLGDDGLLSRSGGASSAAVSPVGSGYPLRYIGPEWSFLAIFGKKNYGAFFNDEVYMYKEALDTPFRHVYPFFFETNQAEFWTDYQRELVETGGSMMAHSGVMDHRQHGEHRGLGPAGTAFPRSDEMAEVMQRDMATLKKFIDAHPEYLLVLAADHGVDEYDYSGYKMHGESRGGNEPFIMIYNPQLPAQGEKWVDVVDVAPTLSLYLRGVDIPMNALGVPHTFFGEDRSARQAEVGALKRSILQLSKAARRRGVSVDTEALRGLLAAPFDDETDFIKWANGTQLDTLRGAARKLKTDIYTVITFPLAQLMVFVIVVAIIVLALLLAYNDKLEFFVLGEHYIGFMLEMLKTLVVYGVCFLQMLFCWWSWAVPADGGFVFRVMSPALCLLVLRNVHTDINAKVGGGLVAAAETLIFRNEIFNAVVLTVTSCFPSLLSWMDGDGKGVMGVVTTVVGCIAVWRQIELYHGSLVGTAFRLDSVPRQMERWSLVGLVVCAWLYAQTAEMPVLFVMGFHVFALPVFVLGFFVYPVRFFVRRRVSDAMLSLATVMHLASKDNPTRQLMIWITVFQFGCLLLPLAEALRLLLAYPRDRLAKHNLSMTGQAINVYMLNQAFFAFYLGLGDRINFDVHPFSGAIGMQAYDTFKAFSAVLMAFHKYGFFLFLVLSTCQLSQLWSLPDPRSIARWLSGTSQRDAELMKQIEHEGQRPDALRPSGQRRLAYYLSDHMSLTVSLFTACTGLGFYLMYSVVARHHPYEQATCTFLLAGFIGAAHNLFSVVLMEFDRRGWHGDIPFIPWDPLDAGEAPRLRRRGSRRRA